MAVRCVWVEDDSMVSSKSIEKIWNPNTER